MSMSVYVEGADRRAGQERSVSEMEVNHCEHDWIYKNWFDTNFQESICAP